MSVSRIPLVIPEKLQESVRSTLANVDVTGLEIEPRRTIEGKFVFDAGSKALHVTDGSNYRQVPIGVVIPKPRGVSPTAKRNSDRTRGIQNALYS